MSDRVCDEAELLCFIPLVLQRRLENSHGAEFLCTRVFVSLFFNPSPWQDFALLFQYFRDFELLMCSEQAESHLLSPSPWEGVRGNCWKRDI